MTRDAWWSGVILGVALVLAACTSAPGGVETLAKVNGWPLQTPGSGEPYALLAIAYDREAAERMWDESVPPSLPERRGTPTEAGVYGELADVDFEEQVVGLVAAGQSGSCPGWVSDVAVTEDGTVIVDTEEDMGGGNACTADYSAYSVILVIDRDDVPARDQLDGADGQVDGDGRLDVQVREYPSAD